MRKNERYTVYNIRFNHTVCSIVFVYVCWHDIINHLEDKGGGGVLGALFLFLSLLLFLAGLRADELELSLSLSWATVVEEELVGEREEEGVGDSLGRKGDKEEDEGSKDDEEEGVGVGHGKNSPGCKSDKPLTVQIAANSNLTMRI